MSRERILITVKTYPTLSSSYGETVCTAGVREDGTWVRIYPVPFRRLGEEQQYKKFDWVECDLYKNTSDKRPESFRPSNPNELQSVGHVDTSGNWQLRREILLRRGRVYNRLAELISLAKTNKISLATFRPTEVLDFRWETDDRQWDQKKLDALRARANQLDLFDDESWRTTFRLVEKIPYEFYYRLKDEDGKESRLSIWDWEVGALYWNCLRRHKSEELALQKVREKYFDEFLKTDLHFFLGTTSQHHFQAPNPWIIIGALAIPHEIQPDMFSL
jgi:hypothetical protein